ncbi:MAG: HD domain-containing protein [Deltaproteobacteria bacterium]|nr:HD domain-containing protein [Deltaproteobacteria bacterium]MBW2537515.1 HD domain-containing protein [Deltaproteobacteria bacterium]
MLLRDPVHGLITFESAEEAIVPRLLETPELQRLRRIRQLGLTSLAFPGAEHTRFAHAIGSAHVMQRFIARIRKLDHDLPFWQRLTSERARDAIAAALLHDLGHGPLSHLFEDALEGTPSHEDWTERIVLDSSTAVHRVLAEDDPELPRRVAGLIRGTHELPFLARMVSGTFDVDRCDYLLRDAHATGVRYGDFDLPWLLQSLRLSAAQSERAPGLAIDGTKGLIAIESFILARLFMFQQVYFHKATRAAEWMIQTILARAVALLRDGQRVTGVPAALTQLALGHDPTVSEYLEMDDQVLLRCIAEWRDGRDGILADLCTRLRARQLFKTLELFGEDAQPAAREHAIATVRDLATEAGLDPDVYTGIDIAEDVPYADDSALVVWFGRSPPRHPGEVSFVLDRLRGETLRRVRLMFAPELRDAVRAALGAS